MVHQSRPDRLRRSLRLLGHSSWQGIAAIVGVFSVVVAVIGVYVQMHDGSAAVGRAGPVGVTIRPAVTGTDPAEPSPTPDSTWSASPSEGTDAGAPLGSGSTAPQFELEVTLGRGDAVDVDTPSAPVKHRQNGTVGANDLFHDYSFADYLSTHDVVYTYPSDSSSVDAYQICAQATGTTGASVDGYSSKAVVYDAGQMLCFVTSEHHLAWVRIESIDPVNGTEVLAVRVWSDHVT